MGLSNLVFMFLYNKFYIKDLIGAGFKAESIANSNMAEADQKIGMEIPRLKIDAWVTLKSRDSYFLAECALKIRVYL